MAAKNQYRLKVGRVVIGLNCPDAAYADSLEQYFNQTSDPQAPDVELDLNLVAHHDQPAIPSSLILTKSLRPDGFDIADGLISGCYDARSGKGEIHVKNVLTSGLLTRVFEQILYQAWHSGRRRLNYDACLIHSAGVIQRGRGFLFVGPSESGKTTVARLSNRYIVLNDEMNLVEFHPDGPLLISTPFNGHFRDKQPGTAPLAAILLLEKGPAHRLEAIGCGEAAGAVAGQIAPPVGLDDIASVETRVAMLDLGTRLIQSVPVKRMSFLPDPGFWSVLTRTFTTDQRG